MTGGNNLAVFHVAKLKRLLVVGFFVITLLLTSQPHFAFGQAGAPAGAIPAAGNTSNPSSGFGQTPTGGGLPAAGGGAANPGGNGGGAAAVEDQAVAKVGEENVMLTYFHDFVITVAGSLVGIAGTVFDKFIVNFIIDFGEHYKVSNLGNVIDGLWGTVRDIFNLTFIFGLLYIGFQIILGTNESEAKRTIPKLIIAALLVNFSLFFVKFIIDFSNIAAVQIYNLFSVAGATGADPVVTAAISGPSISQGFLNSIGIGNLFRSIPPSGELLYIFGLLIVFVILIYVFMMGAILIAIRFAVLCMYLVFSPVMFIGWVFPNFGSLSKKYWEGLLGQAFMAPAFLFMLYLSFRIVDTFNDTKAGTTLRANFETQVAQGAFGGDVTGSFATVFPFFIMTVVFLLASMSIAKSLSERGSKMSISAVQKMKTWGGGMMFGSAALAGQYTFGAAAKGINNSDTYKRIVTSKFNPIGLQMQKATSKVADGNFDMRGIAGLGKETGAGDAMKGGFKTRMKEREKAKKEFLEEVGTSKNVSKQTEAHKENVERAQKAKKDREAELKAKKEEVTIHNQPDRDAIISLNREYRTATNEARKNEIANQVNSLKAKIETKEKELDKFNEAVANATAQFESASNGLKTSMAQDKYRYQLAYIKDREDSYFAKATKPIRKVLPGVALGYSHNAVTEALRKEYGATGEDKDKHNDHKKIIEEMKHAMDGGHSPVAPTPKTTSPTPAGDSHGGGGGH